MPQTDGLWCENGLQHSFVVTAWQSPGAESSWATELMCPTCDTIISRSDDGAWRWIAPGPDD